MSRVGRGLAAVVPWVVGVVLASIPAGCGVVEWLGELAAAEDPLSSDLRLLDPGGAELVRVAKDGRITVVGESVGRFDARHARFIPPPGEFSEGGVDLRAGPQVALEGDVFRIARGGGRSLVFDGHELLEDGRVVVHVEGLEHSAVGRDALTAAVYAYGGLLPAKIADAQARHARRVVVARNDARASDAYGAASLAGGEPNVVARGDAPATNVWVTGPYVVWRAGGVLRVVDARGDVHELRRDIGLDPDVAVAGERVFVIPRSKPELVQYRLRNGPVPEVADLAMVLGEGPRILDVGDDVVVLRGRAVGTRVLTVWSLADGSHSKPVSFDAPAFGSALHDGSVYFADRDRIFSRALDADAEVSLVVPDPAFHVPARASGEWAGHGVMVDASFVYYFAPSEADPGHDALVRLPNTGEPAEPDVVVSDLGRVACFAHAADAVAVGTRGTDGGDDASLVVVAKRDKTVSQREGLTTPADVAIDASRVYWVGPDDDSVRALDLVGGSRRRSYP